MVHDHLNILVAKILRQLGVSNCISHYVLDNLKDQGSAKVKNLPKNPNKCNYSYILTTTGLSEKPKFTAVFWSASVGNTMAPQQETSALEKSVGLDHFSAENP